MNTSHDSRGLGIEVILRISEATTIIFWNTASRQHEAIAIQASRSLIVIVENFYVTAVPPEALRHRRSSSCRRKELYGRYLSPGGSSGRSRHSANERNTTTRRLIPSNTQVSQPLTFVMCCATIADGLHQPLHVLRRCGRDAVALPWALRASKACIRPAAHISFRAPHQTTLPTLWLPSHIFLSLFMPSHTTSRTDDGRAQKLGRREKKQQRSQARHRTQTDFRALVRVSIPTSLHSCRCIIAPFGAHLVLGWL